MSHIEPDDLATLALDGIRPEGALARTWRAARHAAQSTRR